MANSFNAVDIHIIQADYSNPLHARDLLFLMNEYAQDPMGGGDALSQHCQQYLVEALQKFPTAYSWLAYQHHNPVGLLNAFLGFSTFKCQPLMNIHDVIVQQQARGLGISRRLFAAAEDHAKALGCCKITLEVLAGNETAKRAYRAFGYDHYQLDETTGIAEFWQKYLN